MYPVQIRFLHDGYDDNKVNKQQKFKRNISILEKHIQQYPDDVLSHSFLGREHLILGNPDAAIRHLVRARELLTASKNSIALAEVERNLVWALDSKGDVAQAESLAFGLTQRFPDYVDGWYMYGMYQLRKVVSLQSAIQHIAKSLELSSKGKYATDPAIGEYKAMLHLADEHRLSGIWIEARKLYAEVLRRAPEYAPAKNVLAQMDKQVLEIAKEIRGNL
ncbi:MULTISPECIES: tetratricopeptide repeat protein [Alicyclobacillus]|uniref:Uncharacterized protein n=1 Tax=Alicyclobacillus acidoterrestris (strain ATCC 49025 / DSM 3922 / CIP 106132 / NCIMB 13137 / GD3B) TaxID=1356854 RepID=T0CYY9_ALIAG|nr:MULTISPECIES: hypothetical protein [Alicyclobacillus]EPZ44497.1 hypothetical protein N007_10790 [Alicyclobacillus acidoterrestris ATCC 49025]UNO49537.1 hypothetical protein K1I37_03025 [Alicyclobacillus acidoterrestris]